MLGKLTHCDKRGTNKRVANAMRMAHVAAILRLYDDGSGSVYVIRTRYVARKRYTKH